MSLSDIAREIGRQSDDGDQSRDGDAMNIIEFVESPHGLGFSKELCGQELFPVQKFILKMFYNIPLDDTETFQIPKNWRHAQTESEAGMYEFTEKEYLEYLYNEGRCNIKKQDGDRHELILPIGRRSGKSTLSAMIAAYETYKLLKKYNPQSYYGLPEGSSIQICSIATSKDQAGLLYKELRRHFHNCDFYKQFLESETQTQAKFHTPHDLDSGSNPSVRATFYSSIAKGIRGSANITAIMDEVAFFNNSGQASASEVYQALSPSLAQFSPKDPNDSSKPIGDSEGRMILISSPYAKRGLFYEQYEMALEGGPGSQDLLMIQAPTWEVNPTIPKEYFEKEYEKDPVAFKTEFGAEFTDRVKTWIEREEDLMACVNPHMKPQTKGKPRDRHFLGFDLAPKGDRTSLTLTRLNDDRIQLAYHEQWQANTDWYELNPHLEEPLIDYAKDLSSVEILDYEKIGDWIEEVCKKFFVVEGIYDSYEGIGFDQILQKRGLSNKIQMENFTRRDASEMYQAFKNMMYREKLELYDYVKRDDEDGSDRNIHAPYIQELLELQGTARGKKTIVVEAPQTKGHYDDFSDSLVRSVWLALDRLSKRQHSSERRGVAGQANSGVGARRQFRSLPRRQREYRRKKGRQHNYHSKRDPNSGNNRG